MHSSELCKTDRRDNGIVAGDTMLVHIGGGNSAYGIMELYCREPRHGWMRTASARFRGTIDGKTASRYGYR